MTLRVLAAAVALAATAVLAQAATRATGYAEGAPVGFSGGFGEPSCHACHFDAELNAGPGRLAIAGVPDRFTPGRQYLLTVTLTTPGMRLGGFQLTARRTEGGAQAGSLAAGSDDRERVRIDVQGGVQYVSQRRTGTSLASAGTATWTLMWTAPAGGASVVFHVAANAGDGDETAEGDFVYTANLESAPGRPAPPRR